MKYLFFLCSYEYFTKPLSLSISDKKDIIIAVCAVITALFAAFSINSWRKETLGKAGLELSKECSYALAKFKSAFNKARAFKYDSFEYYENAYKNRIKMTAEEYWQELFYQAMGVDTGKEPIASKDKLSLHMTIISKRINALQKSYQGLEESIFAIEGLLNKKKNKEKIISSLNNLQNCVDKFNNAIQNSRINNEVSEENRDIIRTLYSKNDNDFSKKIDMDIDNISKLIDPLLQIKHQENQALLFSLFFVILIVIILFLLSIFISLSVKIFIV